MEKTNRNNNIKRLYKKGLSYGSIAKLVGISRARVHQIVSDYCIPKTELKRQIFERDNYTCQWGERCLNKKLPKDNLIIHHINFNNRNNRIENLITLCRKCHSSFHSNNHIDKKIEKRMSNNITGIISTSKKDYSQQYRLKYKEKYKEYNKKYLREYYKKNKEYYKLKYQKNREIILKNQRLKREKIKVKKQVKYNKI